MCKPTRACGTRLPAMGNPMKSRTAEPSKGGISWNAGSFGRFWQVRRRSFFTFFRRSRRQTRGSVHPSCNTQAATPGRGGRSQGDRTAAGTKAAGIEHWCPACSPARRCAVTSLLPPAAEPAPVAVVARRAKKRRRRKPVQAVVVEAPSTPVAKVVKMLKQPDALAAAWLLGEIFGMPRSRRRR